MSTTKEQTEEVILAIDVGSSSVKCFAYSIVKEATVENAFSPPSPPTVQAIPGAHASKAMRAVSPQTGHVVDLQGIFEAVDDCVSLVLQHLESSSCNRVVAVGFSSFTMNLVAVDEEGAPIGEEATITYACNSNEVVEEVERLKRQLGAEERELLYQNTGAPLHSAYALAQLRVLYNSNNNPDLCDEIDCWQSISNLILSRWTGQSPRSIPLSFSEASWTGLFNFRTGLYEPSALALLPSAECRRALPPLVCDFDESVYSGLTAHYQAKWPQLARDGTSFFLGFGDGASANVGSKCNAPHRIACTIGTSAAARACVPLPIVSPPLEEQHQQQAQQQAMQVPDGLFCYRVDRYNVLLGGALTDGGSVMEWIRQLLNLNDDAEFEACMERVGASIRAAEERAHEEEQEKKEEQSTNNTVPLTTVPFLSGERSVGYRGGATGVLYGITRETTATDLVQSCLEGVSLRLGAIVERLQQVVSGGDSEKPKIVVSGKGLEVNKIWRQVIANCTRLEALLDKGTLGGTSRGVAIMILSRLHRESSSSATSEDGVALPAEPLQVEPELHYHPQPSSGTYWKKLSQQQESIISAVSPLYSRK